MLPHWIGIPGVIVLIAYGVRQGMKITTRQEGDPPQHQPPGPN
ncbi:hypothetical protein QA641_41460 [Bradyrhizobium sp. CB1650]|nr:hypothetical protein [Bradyrhizobium sp. CB1650]WGD51810.1 hypothetical protein QA641_41460 [Bradyrhizobium sp. CB1650]